MSADPIAWTRLRVEDNKIIHVHRRLQQGLGMMLVNPGYEVEPDTLLGQGQSHAGFKIIDLARELGVPAKEGLLYVKRKLGQTLAKGEMVAEKQGLLGLGSKQILASNEAILHSYDPKTGHLKLKLIPKQENLVAGVYGIVDQVDNRKGEVIIRTQAKVIHGVLGSGRERTGNLHMLHDLTPDLIGKIVVGNSVMTTETLEKCLSFGVPGFISGGINAADYRKMMGGSLSITQPKWSDSGISLVMTEGFGPIPLGQDLVQELQPYEGRFCLLDGNNRQIILPTFDQHSMMYIRKTKIPIKVQGTIQTISTVPIKVGDQVRIIAPGAVGVQGKVEMINQQPTTLPTGPTVIMVTVATKTDKKSVPLENIEVL